MRCNIALLVSTSSPSPKAKKPNHDALSFLLSSHQFQEHESPHGDDTITITSLTDPSPNPLSYPDTTNQKHTLGTADSSCIACFCPCPCSRLPLPAPRPSLPSHPRTPPFPPTKPSVKLGTASGLINTNLPQSESENTRAGTGTNTVPVRYEVVRAKADRLILCRDMDNVIEIETQCGLLPFMSLQTRFLSIHPSLGRNQSKPRRR
jgi:hypothetical protein